MCPRLKHTDQTYMGGTGPCGPIMIILGNHICSQYASLNFKFGVNRTFCVPKTQYTDLIYMEGTRPCGPIKIILGYHIQSKYASLNIKFGVNRTFRVPQTQYTDLIYMRGVRYCELTQPNQRMDNTRLCAKFQLYSSLRSDDIVFITDGWTDGQTDIFNLIKKILI